MWVATFRLHTASLHQAMRSTGYVKPYKALCSAVVCWFSTAVIGAFRSSLFRWVVLSAVRFFAALPLLCFLVVGSHASGISIPLSLLMLLGWSLMWIASLTLRVYQCGSRSINFTSRTAERKFAIYKRGRGVELGSTRKTSSLVVRARQLKTRHIRILNNIPKLIRQWIIAISKQLKINKYEVFGYSMKHWLKCISSQLNQELCSKRRRKNVKIDAKWDHVSKPPPRLLFLMFNFMNYYWIGEVRRPDHSATLPPKLL